MCVCVTYIHLYVTFAYNILITFINSCDDHTFSFALFLFFIVLGFYAEVHSNILSKLPTVPTKSRSIHKWLSVTSCLLTMEHY